MNEKESYGIELELITTKFNKKVDEIKKTVSKMKDQFKIGLHYDKKEELSISTSVAKLKNKIDELGKKRDKYKLFPDADKEIQNIQDKIRELSNEREKLRIASPLREEHIEGWGTNPSGVAPTYTDREKADALEDQIEAYRQQIKELQSEVTLNDENTQKVQEIITDI